MKCFQIYKGLPQNTYILFFVQLINRMGDFVIPFLSLFLVTKLNLNTYIAGIVVTCATLIQIPGSMAGGTIADNYSRKHTYLFFQTFAAIVIMMCAFVENETLIIILLVSSAFFSSAAKPLINTMIYDSLEPDQRRTGQSLSYLGINLGVCIGPIIAGICFNNYLKLFFLIDAFTSFAAVLLVKFQLQELMYHKEKIKDKSTHNSQFIIQILKEPKIFFFFLIYIIYNFIYAQHSFALPLTLENIFSSNGSVIFGYIISINAITVVLTTAFITYYTRNKTPLFNTMIAGIFYAVGFGMITVATNLYIFIISTVLWTIGEILISTNSEIYVVNQSHESMRARCCALMNIVNSVGRAMGLAFMGKYIDSFGLTSVWPFVMGLGFIASILTYCLSRYNEYTKKYQYNSKI